MTSLMVELGARRYPVHVGRDGTESLRAELARLAPSALVVVSDENVAAWHLPDVESLLAPSGLLRDSIVLEPGERTKSLDTARLLWGRFAAARLDRKALVIVLGGGVPGDVAGFAAATWLRGVRWLPLPTSLLSQIDSATGGKTAVNLPEGKNMVGAYHQPSAVIVATDRLSTLPDDELRAGLGEALKYAVLEDRALFDLLEREPERVLAREPAAIEQVVLSCLRIKCRIVSEDETEGGARMLLNLGHTLGHALEAIGGYSRYRHGEAVAIGLVAAARLAERLGRAATGFAERLEQVVLGLGLAAHPDPFEPDELFIKLRSDKKARKGALRFILPLDVGKVEVLADAPEADVRRIVEGMARR